MAAAEPPLRELWRELARSRHVRGQWPGRDQLRKRDELYGHVGTKLIRSTSGILLVALILTIVSTFSVYFGVILGDVATSTLARAAHTAFGALLAVQVGSNFVSIILVGPETVSISSPSSTAALDATVQSPPTAAQSPTPVLASSVSAPWLSPQNPAPARSSSTWCQVCHRSRPERSHHCRVCGCCVKKRDHHCPWLATCRPRIDRDLQTKDADHCSFGYRSQ